jgi:hypothetical protein
MLNINHVSTEHGSHVAVSTFFIYISREIELDWGLQLGNTPRPRAITGQIDAPARWITLGNAPASLPVSQPGRLRTRVGHPRLPSHAKRLTKTPSLVGPASSIFARRSTHDLGGTRFICIPCPLRCRSESIAVFMSSSSSVIQDREIESASRGRHVFAI